MATTDQDLIDLRTTKRVTAITLNIVSMGDQAQVSNGLDPPGIITITADDA